MPTSPSSLLSAKSTPDNSPNANEEDTIRLEIIAQDLSRQLEQNPEMPLHYRQSLKRNERYFRKLSTTSIDVLNTKFRKRSLLIPNMPLSGFIKPNFIHDMIELKYPSIKFNNAKKYYKRVQIENSDNGKYKYVNITDVDIYDILLLNDGTAIYSLEKIYEQIYKIYTRAHDINLLKYTYDNQMTNINASYIYKTTRYKPSEIIKVNPYNVIGVVKYYEGNNGTINMAYKYWENFINEWYKYVTTYIPHKTSSRQSR